MKTIYVRLPDAYFKPATTTTTTKYSIAVGGFIHWYRMRMKLTASRIIEYPGLSIPFVSTQKSPIGDVQFKKKKKWNMEIGLNMEKKTHTFCIRFGKWTILRKGENLSFSILVKRFEVTWKFPLKWKQFLLLSKNYYNSIHVCAITNCTTPRYVNHKLLEQ